MLHYLLVYSSSLFCVIFSMLYFSFTELVIITLLYLFVSRPWPVLFTLTVCVLPAACLLFLSLFMTLFSAEPGLCCCCGLRLAVARGGRSCCGLQSPRCGGFSSCGAQALGAWASLVAGPGLPAPGIEPVPPASAGGFLTTGPPGKS